MSENNGVIRVGRKGTKKFAFGEDGLPFAVDVVVAFQQWICIDDAVREQYENRDIPASGMAAYNQAAVEFVRGLATPRGGSLDAAEPPDLTTAEALDFIARLCEEHDKLVDFFRPRKREKERLPDTSGVDLQFSEEGS